MENKEVFFGSHFKPNTHLKKYPFPIDANEFNEETQCVITLMSQFLGLEKQKYVMEPLMSLLFTLRTCPTDSEESRQLAQLSCLKFDEFLAENIHSQLVGFPKIRTFIFLSYLLRMFFPFNEENMQLPEMVITEGINIDYSNFMKFLMLEVYSAFFQKRLPRVLPQMREILKFSPKRRIRDRFLSKHDIVIRLYGFVNQPFILLAFLTPRVFSLEMIRQRIIVENENFLNFRKSSQIRFPCAIGPFNVKKKILF